ncbi:hypothetical protein BCR44DRAFT_260974 [Catenaria anguillulae PL171]|uniref:Bromo domain-containing protein n=1 Tax=Catenaria anguillulae PL171 TaxID=765915 RepID=A0A1Y2HMN1_9FUNG|nr:hypothetical protein BCR44DRAFT_260974 [Catenaria anguillulae PL171]
MDVVSDPDNPAWVGVLVDPPPMPAQQSQQPLQQLMPTADTPARKGRGRKSTTTAATPASAATALAGVPTTAPTVAASSTDAAATTEPIPAPNGQTPAPITIPTAPNGQPMPSPAHPRSAGTITPPQLTPTGQLTDHQIMLNLLNRIAQAKDQSGRSIAEVFHTLPSAKEYPDYYEAIPRPVSLTEIHSRLQNAVTAANNPTTAANNPLAAYTVPEFRNDVIRMFANAMYYNEESSQIYTDAAQLLEAFKQEAANAFKERIVAITDSTLVAGQVTGPGRFVQGKDGQIVLIERIGKTLRGADMIEGTIFMTHDGFPRAESFLPGEVYRYERFEFASAYFVRQCHVMFARDFSQGFPSGFNINNVYVCEQQLTTRSLVPIQSWTAGLNTPPVAVNLLSHGFNLQLTRFESPTSLQEFSTMVREGKLPQSAAPQNQQQSGPSAPAPTPRRRGRPRKSETMAAEAAANAVGAFVTPSPGVPAATPAAKMGRKSRTATNVTQVMQTPTVPMPVQPVRPGLMMPPSVAAPVGVVQQGQKPMQMAVQYGQQGPQQQQQQQHYQQQGPQQPQLAMRPPQIQYQQASHQYPQSPVMPTMTAGQQQQMPGQLLTPQQLQQQQQAYYFQQQQQQLAYLQQQQMQQQQQQRPAPIVTPSANTMPGYAPQAQGTGLGQTQSQQVVAHAVSAGPPSSAAVATPVSATSSSRSEKNKPRLIPFIRIEVPGRTMLLEFTPQVPNQSIHVPSSATCIKILPIAVSPTLLPLPADGSSPTTTGTGEANGINGASGTITQAAGPIMGTIPFGIAVMRGGKVLNPRYGPDVPLKTSLQEYLLRDDVAAAHGLDPARYFAGPVIETDLTEGVTIFEVWATAQPAGATKEMQASQLHVVRV